MAKKNKGKKVIDPVAEEVKELLSGTAEPAPVLKEPEAVPEVKEQPIEDAAPTPAPAEEPGEEKAVATIDDLDPAQMPDEAMQLYNLMREGYNEAELRIMHKDWRLKKFKALVKRAKEIQAKAVQDTEAARAEIVAKYDHLYKLAMKVGNIKEAKNILDSKAKVLGLTKDNLLGESGIIAVWG